MDQEEFPRSMRAMVLETPGTESRRRELPVRTPGADQVLEGSAVLEGAAVLVAGSEASPATETPAERTP